MTDESLVVDLNAASVHHLLSSSHLSQDDSADTVTIVPADRSVYVIKMRMNIYVYSDFTEFIGKLDELLDGNNRVSRLFSTGIYEADSEILTNTYLTIEIK